MVQVAGGKAMIKMKAAVLQLWNESGSPRSFLSQKTENEYRATVLRSAQQNSRLQFVVVAGLVLPASIMDLIPESGAAAPLFEWTLRMATLAAFTNVLLVLLSTWACVGAITRAAEKLFSSLSWHRLLTICLGTKAFTGQMSSPELSLMLIGVGLSGLFIIPSFSQHVAGVFLLALLHCLPLFYSSGRAYDPDLPQFLAATVVCLIPAIAWVHGNRRRRFLADAATSTFKLALAVNQGSMRESSDPALPKVREDPYFTEEEAELLQDELKRETALMTERDTKRTDAPRDQLFISSKILGRGAYGVVSVAIDTVTHEKMALKQCTLGGGNARKKKSGQHALLSEIAMLRVLRHPHVIEYKASALQNDSLSLLVELCGGGSLKQVLREGGALSEPQARVCMKQLLSGVHYLHLLGLAHLDLKPQNILIRQGALKISDFGGSKWVHSERTRAIRGTLPYLAPEVARAEGGGRKADMWALGCIMLELLTCELLWVELSEENKWKEDTQDRVLKKIQSLTDTPPPIPSASSLSPSALLCLSTCLQPQSAKRPTAFKLQQHAFFQDCTQQDLALDQDKFGSPGAEKERNLEDVSQWWFVRWYSQVKESFANPEMEREFLLEFSGPRILLLLSLARIDLAVRVSSHIISIFMEPSWEQCAVLAMMIPNFLLLFAPVGNLTLIWLARWFMRIISVVWILFVNNRQPFFSNLWTVTLSMMIFCQLAVSVIETCVWCGILGLVFQLPHLADDVWQILNRKDGSGPEWRGEVEDTLSMAALTVLMWVTSTGFSFHYVKSERRKFFRTFYMRLAHDDSESLSGKAQSRDSSKNKSRDSDGDAPASPYLKKQTSKHA